MNGRYIDLKPLLPGMKTCDLTVGENGKATLRADNGELHVSRELTAAELSRLSATLGNEFSHGRNQTATCYRYAEYGYPLGGGIAEFRARDVPAAGTDGEFEKIKAWRYDKMRDDTAM